MSGLDFVCVLFNGTSTDLPSYSKGAGYSTAWVDRLYRGISRQMPHQQWRLICLTDADYYFQEPVQQVALDRPGLGWACIMEAFRPGLTFRRRMIVGLDTLFVGPLDEILEYDGECGLLRDPYETHTICNGVGIFSHDMATQLWTQWDSHRHQWEKEAVYMGQVSEMKFLRLVVGDTCNLLDQIYPQQIQSYKVHWKPQKMDRDKARIVYFHGRPKMQEIEDEELLAFWQ